MRQLTMLPAIDLRPIKSLQDLDSEVKNKMETIVELAADFQPLINCLFRLIQKSGDSFPYSPYSQAESYQKRLDTSQNRKERIKRFLESVQQPEESIYLIMAGNELIGFASIQDGWNPVAMDYEDPYVELALIHPQYNQYGIMVNQQLNEQLLEIKSKRDW